MADSLPIWTVYQNPKDHPGKFVSRRWESLPTPRPTGEVIIANTLEEVREQLPPGLTRLAPQQGDDATIVENWI